MTRVMLIDADTLARTRFRRILEHGGQLQVVAEVASAAEAARTLGTARPDVLLLGETAHAANGRTPDLASFGMLARIPSVLLIPRGPQRDSHRDGALGHVATESAVTEVVQAVRLAAAGKPFVSPGLSQRSGAAQSEHTVARQPDPLEFLTHREREVLDLLAQGKAPKEIAAELGSSAATVRVHHRSILAKLQLRSDVELGLFLADLRWRARESP